MLITSNSPVLSTNSQLVKLWATQYLPDWANFLEQQGHISAKDLIELSTDAGRTKTVETIRRYLRLHCELAGVETHGLFSSSTNVINLAEVRRLAKYVEEVYLKLLEMHQRRLFSDVTFVLEYLSNEEFHLAQSFEVPLPAIAQLAAEIAPVMTQLREQHLASKDPKAIGFITTQFHFTTKVLLKNLSPIEQLLINPYFQFAEEQVCVPWQQVCEAATKYPADVMSVTIVKQFLPLSNLIARTVYQRSLEKFSAYQSRRGSLHNAHVRASIIRDLKMFQAYLWLSVLEESLETVQRELLPACLIVFPSVKVSWKLVDQMLALLIGEIRARMTPEEWMVIEPYARSLQEIFELTDEPA
jgi:hypothetical protein